MMVAAIPDEIRTPLNGILGFTELLASQKDIDHSKKTKFSGIIKKNAESLMQIINDILDISKLETGQISIVKRKFNLNETLLNLHSLYTQKLADVEKNHLDLKLVAPQEKVILNTDENRLSQVFINLLDNALKFTHKGSISFGVKEILDSKIVFEVSDSGIGIAPDKQSIIFERFAQAGNEISVNYGGNGLGLSIVKKLIGLMGGEIIVESNPGKGSKFIFHLPLN